MNMHSRLITIAVMLGARWFDCFHHFGGMKFSKRLTLSMIEIFSDMRRKSAFYFWARSIDGNPNKSVSSLSNLRAIICPCASLVMNDKWSSRLKIHPSLLALLAKTVANFLFFRQLTMVLLLLLEKETKLEVKIASPSLRHRSPCVHLSK